MFNGIDTMASSNRLFGRGVGLYIGLLFSVTNLERLLDDICVIHSFSCREVLLTFDTTSVINLGDILSTLNLFPVRGQQAIAGSFTEVVAF